MEENEDDLPSDPNTPPHEPTLAGSLGQIFGALVWIIPLFALGGLVAWFLIRWMH